MALSWETFDHLSSNWFNPIRSKLTIADRLTPFASIQLHRISKVLFPFSHDDGLQSVQFTEQWLVVRFPLQKRLKEQTITNGIRAERLKGSTYPRNYKANTLSPLDTGGPKEESISLLERTQTWHVSHFFPLESSWFNEIGFKCLLFPFEQTMGLLIDVWFNWSEPIPFCFRVHRLKVQLLNGRKQQVRLVHLGHVQPSNGFPSSVKSSTWRLLCGGIVFILLWCENNKTVRLLAGIATDWRVLERIRDDCRVWASEHGSAWTSSCSWTITWETVSLLGDVMLPQCSSWYCEELFWLLA